LRPLADLGPSAVLLAANRRLPVHLDHWHNAELREERWPEYAHFVVVLRTGGVELVQRRGARLPQAVEPVLEFGEPEVPVDRFALINEQPLQLGDRLFVVLVERAQP
jgi:hypothetical protein